MIKYTPASEISLQLFSTPFEQALDRNNKWVKMAKVVPWDKMAQVFFKRMSRDMGRGSVNLRIILGAILVKHIKDLSDEDTITCIQENLYVQYFVGLPGFTVEPVFVPSLFVEIRKRLGRAGAMELNELVIKTAVKLKAIEHREKKHPPSPRLRRAKKKSEKEQGENTKSDSATKANSKTRNQCSAPTAQAEQAQSSPNKGRLKSKSKKEQGENTNPDSTPKTNSKAKDQRPAPTAHGEQIQADPNEGWLKFNSKEESEENTNPDSTPKTNSEAKDQRPAPTAHGEQEQSSPKQGRLKFNSKKEHPENHNAEDHNSAKIGDADQVYITIIENEEEQNPKPDSEPGANHQAEDHNSAKVAEAADKEQATTNRGTLKMDASVFPQNITYPTDTKLVNKARKITEELIDELYYGTGWWDKKPRTYRKEAKKRYSSFSKTRNPNKTQVRKCVGKQLRYIRRNLNHLDKMVGELKEAQVEIPWVNQDWKELWVIREVYRQQLYMHQNRCNRVDDRIVNISQPHVRPIMRGKAGKKVEFGAKAQVCETEGFVWIDYIDFNNFNESGYLELSVESYKRIFGYYPEVVLVDRIYLTRENRKYLKSKGIRHCGAPLGRPLKMTAEEKQKRKKEQNKRSTIEGKFGTAKTKYGLEENEMKLPETSVVASILTFLGMNVLKLEKEASFAFFYALLYGIEKFWWHRIKLKRC